QGRIESGASGVGGDPVDRRSRTVLTTKVAAPVTPWTNADRPTLRPVPRPGRRHAGALFLGDAQRGRNGPCARDGRGAGGTAPIGLPPLLGRFVRVIRRNTSGWRPGCRRACRWQVGFRPEGADPLAVPERVGQSRPGGGAVPVGTGVSAEYVRRPQAALHGGSLCNQSSDLVLNHH